MFNPIGSAGMCECCITTYILDTVMKFVRDDFLKVSQLDRYCRLCLSLFHFRFMSLHLETSQAFCHHVQITALGSVFVMLPCRSQHVTAGMDGGETAASCTQTYFCFNWSKLCFQLWVRYCCYCSSKQSRSRHPAWAPRKRYCTVCALLQLHWLNVSVFHLLLPWKHAWKIYISCCWCFVLDSDWLFSILYRLYWV